MTRDPGGRWDTKWLYDREYPTVIDQMLVTDRQNIDMTRDPGGRWGTKWLYDREYPTVIDQMLVTQTEYWHD